MNRDTGPNPSQALTSGTEAGIEWFTWGHPLLGIVNGYVRIPQDHPWRHFDADHITALINASQFFYVHGGLTYGPDEDGWVGFDTGHFADRWATGLWGERMHALDAKFPPAPQDVTEWDLQTVSHHCIDIAAAIAQGAEELTSEDVQ